MLYNVKVNNPCRCFLRSTISESQNFKNEEDAKMEAENMIAKMQKEFCKKHDFKLRNIAGDFEIEIVPR